MSIDDALGVVAKELKGLENPQNDFSKGRKSAFNETVVLMESAKETTEKEIKKLKDSLEYAHNAIKYDID